MSATTYSGAILDQYITKIHTAFQKFESFATKAMNALVERVKELYDKVIKSIRKQAYTNIVGGVGAGVFQVGAGFTTQSTLQNIFSTFSKIVTPVKDVVNTFIEAIKVKAQQDSSLEREHVLERQRKLKEEISGARQRQEESTTKVLDLESRAYHTN
jgi:hypothetical protein